jgi:hypothetical protein
MVNSASLGEPEQALPHPPASFLHVSEIPETEYRTAVAILHSERMRAVSITFELKEHAGTHATYAAVCPRCNAGEIIAVAELQSDGSFKEQPACPTLCMACEDRLDAMLEPEGGFNPDNEPAGRATLDKHLKEMARSWSRKPGT